jgi:hypothetical protein
MANINTLKSIADSQALKSDPWAYALNKFSIGNTDMEDGDKLYKVPSSVPLAEYVRQFPKAKYVSLEERNTPTKTDRVLYIHDIYHRVIHMTASLEVKDEEVFVARLPARKTSLVFWCVKKLFFKRPKTRRQMRKH